MTLIDLPFSTPVLNAAGTLGYNPEARNLHLEGLGGFITNPISFSPRSPAHGERMIRYAGGFLLHTGYPNPGFHQVLNKNRQRWIRSRLPVVVHLLSENPDSTYRMVRTLEDTEGVRALEIGLPPGASPEYAGAILQAAVGELPVIARIGLEDIPHLIDDAVEAGVSAISMGAPRGSLPAENGEVVSGRLMGAAVFPQALEILRQIKTSIVQIFFSGGIQHQDQIDLVLREGAAGVQLDLSLWRNGGFTAPE